MLFVRDYLTDQTVLRSSGAPEHPLVSVVLPTYSRARNGMLRRSIASVLAQTMTDFELLVMDDGSTDGSSELIEEFRGSDPRVVHVRHERNSGIHSIRLNEGIAMARGRYVAFQFDDDYWHPVALKALAEEVEKPGELRVVVGKAHLQGEGEIVLPAVPLNLINLHEQNRLANNAVLIPREMFERYGMYDCHIGMRRLCDWDLWLRYIRHVPFVVIDELISEVFVGNEGSLGVTVPWDLALFRYLHEIRRGELLTPSNWGGYEIDSLRIGEVQIEGDLRRRLYEEQIAPYYMRFRHNFPQVEGFMPTEMPPRKTVLLTKRWYDSPIDVGLRPYDALANRRGTYKAYLEPDPQIEAGWVGDADALLLVRTIEGDAKLLMQQGFAADKPVGYYLDDDMLGFHEYGPEFGYIAPGTQDYAHLTEMIAGADAVWAVTEPIRRTVEPLNPRVLPHNGAVLEEWLPKELRPRVPGEPVRIAYVGGGYRIDEFRMLWEALRSVSEELGDRIAFEFWGMDVSSLAPLASPTVSRAYVPSYEYYLRRLQSAKFDILLSPLLESPRPRLAKSIPKYYEAAAAGALCIFSDVEAYRRLADGLTCLKAANTRESWRDTLMRAISMPIAEFDRVRRRALEHVRDEYTERVQIFLHEAAWRATEFHSATRARRHADGKPRVLYVFHSAYLGGGEIGLWRQVQIARRYGIEPVVLFPGQAASGQADARWMATLKSERIQTEYAAYTGRVELPSDAAREEEIDPSERAELERVVRRHAPALVHSVTLIPPLGDICRELGIPHVVTLYQCAQSAESAGPASARAHCAVVQSDSVRYASFWGNVLSAAKVCARQPVPEEFFNLGLRRRWECSGGGGGSRATRMIVAGTVQPRKQQLEIIEAFGRVVGEGTDARLDIYGYTEFFPQYVDECRRRVQDLGLQSKVSFHPFESNMVRVLEEADVVLSLGTFESLPTTIKEAMAAEVLNVATPVGGIPEVVRDGISGILCADGSVEGMADGLRRAVALDRAERDRIVRQARRVARFEFHPQRAASDLFLSYNIAIERTVGLRRPTANDRRNLAFQAETIRRDRIERPKGPPHGHLPVGKGLRYRVVPARDGWCGIDVIVGTHHRRVDGSLRLNVRAPGGEILRSCDVDLTRISDNSWVQLQFPAIAHSAGVHFGVELTVATPRRRMPVSIYETAAPDRRTLRLLRRAGANWTRSALYCSLRYAD